MLAARAPGEPLSARMGDLHDQQHHDHRTGEHPGKGAGDTRQRVHLGILCAEPPSTGDPAADPDCCSPSSSGAPRMPASCGPPPRWPASAGKADRRSVVLPYRRACLPVRKRPAAEDAVTARRVLLDGPARDADSFELVSELAPLHPPVNTFPGSGHSGLVGLAPGNMSAGLFVRLTNCESFVLSG
jgi:hypothetical protein